MSYIQNIGPEVCIRGKYIARACEGYIFSEDTNFRSYILYITQFGVLYNIYIIWCHLLHSVHMEGLYTIYKIHHIKGMMSPSYYIYPFDVVRSIYCIWTFHLHTMQEMLPSYNILYIT